MHQAIVEACEVVSHKGESRWYHDNFNTPDDLSIWPPELGGGANNA